MITATINPSFTTITVTSTIFTATNVSATLTIKRLCETKEYTVNLVPSATSYVINNDLFSITEDVLSNGPYYIKLVVIDSSNDTKTEAVCKLVNNGIICEHQNLYLDPTTNAVKILALEGLIRAESCGSCSCKEMCTLYNLLIDSNTNDCGCE